MQAGCYVNTLLRDPSASRSERLMRAATGNRLKMGGRVLIAHKPKEPIGVFPSIFLQDRREDATRRGPLFPFAAFEDAN